MSSLNIGQDFSPDPAGRFRTDGDGSGEAFREDFLKPRLKLLEAGQKLEIILDDGVEGYGSSFLVEGFAGLVKFGVLSGEELLDKIEILYEDQDFEFYKNKIIEYIRETKFNSKIYTQQN